MIVMLGPRLEYEVYARYATRLAATIGMAQIHENFPCGLIFAVCGAASSGAGGFCKRSVMTLLLRAPRRPT